MSPARPLKTELFLREHQNDGVSDELVARLVLDMGGEILYTNVAGEKLVGMVGLKGRNFLKIAEFTDAEEAFRHSPLLFAQENTIFMGLRSGLHDIIFPESGRQARLQFDRISAKSGSSYIVVSALEQDETFTQTVEDFLNHPPVMDRLDLEPFLNLSNDLLCVSGPEGFFENVNERFSGLLKTSSAEMLKRTFLDIVHPDDRSAVRAAMQTLQHDDTISSVIDFECRVMSDEGQDFWIEWKHKKEDGKLYSVGRDISSIKAHEQALHRREQQLSEAEAIGHMGHWHWTIGTQEIRFSDEIYRIFGTTRQEFTPTLDSVNARLHRRDVGRMIQAFQRAIIEQNDHEIDFRVITPDGETRHIRCQGRCEFDNEGDVVGLYGIMQDVTQAMQHERALLESKESVERAYAAKSQFLANMSHELRTPLNAIIGFSEMIQQQLLGPIGNERYLDYIKGIRESGEHLLDLITDILDMSRIEAGKYELDLENLNIAKSIRLAVHMIEGRAADSGIRVAVNIPDETLYVVADRRAVMQIMLNLLSNAVKFSHPRGVVEVECVSLSTHVSIRVKDHGIGIPANKIKTITNPFEQAANQYTRSHEGSGLGLAITKELVELHQGSLHIESTVDVGTTVTVRLPFGTKK